MTDPIAVGFVHVVGSVGSGKSTLLQRAAADPAAFCRALARSPAFAWLRDWDDALIVVAPEDPAAWKSQDGEPLLDLMYKDPVAHAAEFQRTVLRTRLATCCDALCQALKAATSTKVLVVTEGCIDVDHGVYARGCFENGYMTKEQWAAYDAIFAKAADWATDVPRLAGAALDVKVRGTLYLTTPLDESIANIKTRGRACEKGLSAAYLDGVIRRHEYLLDSATYSAPPVLRVRYTPFETQEPFIEC